MHPTEKKNSITSFFITHHNRLRGLAGEKYTENSIYQFAPPPPPPPRQQTGSGAKDKYIGFKNIFGFSDNTLPLLPIQDSNVCNSYANNFCLKIVYTPAKNNIDISIPFPGYPDKGALSEGCKQWNWSSDDGVMKQDGGTRYNYCCGELKDNINTNIIRAALIGYYVGDKFIPGVFFNTDNKITIYVVRHGNSLHNQPTNISGKLRLDSSLTPLGIYQAYLLGKTLDKMYHDEFGVDTNIILCSSFLCRTQLTGLTILNAILGTDKLPNKLKHDYILLLQNAVYRFNKTGKNQDIFLGFSPLNKKPSDPSYINFIKFKPIPNIELWNILSKPLKGGFRSGSRTDTVYNYITHPQTGGKVSVYSKTGEQILKGYMAQLGGHEGLCGVNSKSKSNRYAKRRLKRQLKKHTNP